MHGPSSLLEVHELLALLPHHACGDVVGAESWEWRRVPIPLGVLGPIPYVASVHHSAIQTCYH
jgi:hypothetical protein